MCDFLLGADGQIGADFVYILWLTLQQTVRNRVDLKLLEILVFKQNKSRFSWCRRTGAREAVLLFTRRCWQPLRNLFPHSLHYGTMFATNWSSNGGLAAEASVTCRRSQWSNSSHFFFALFSAYAFFCDMTTTPKLGTKDLLKAQRWVVSNLLPLLYKPNSLTPYTITPLYWGQFWEF